MYVLFKRFRIKEILFKSNHNNKFDKKEYFLKLKFEFDI